MNQIEQNQTDQSAPVQKPANRWGTFWLVLILAAVVAGFAFGIVPLPL